MKSEDQSTQVSTSIYQQQVHLRPCDFTCFRLEFFPGTYIPLAYARAEIVVVDLEDQGSHIQQDHMTADDFDWQLPLHMTLQAVGLAFVVPTCRKCCRRYAAAGVPC